MQHVKKTINWMSTIRRRALWVVVGIVATTVAIITATALPALPVIGVAFATVVLVLNTLTSDIRATSCLSCGTDLQAEPEGEHGKMCPACGAVHQRLVEASDADTSTKHTT